MLVISILLHAPPILKLSRDYFLNFTPAGPITITYYAVFVVPLFLQKSNCKLH